MAYLNGKRVFSVVKPVVSHHESDPTVPEWAKQPNKPQYNAEEVGAIPAADYENISSRIMRNSKRLDNIEAGIPADDFIVDATAAEVKDVPEGVLPFAEVVEIGGLTQRVNIGTEESPEYVLRSAPTEAVESMGANLFDYNTYLKNGKKYSFSVIPNRTLYRNPHIGYASGWRVYDNGGVLLGTFETYSFSATKPLQLPSNASYIECIDLSVSEPLYIGYDSDTTYRPYVRNTLPIPEAVRNIDGYGWGVNDEVYNYVDWEKKQFVKRVGKIAVDGTNVKITGGDFGYNPPYGNMSVASAKPLQSPLSNRFIGALYSAKRGTCEINASRMLTIFPSDTSILSIADFNAWFANNPTEFYYELATPIVEDISDILPADNLIGVEGGGTVRMVSEYGYDVPNTIVYQLDNESEVSA